jgi:hypothetical protein
MRRAHNPLHAGSAALGVPCATCARPFGIGDRTVTIVRRAHFTPAGLVLDAALVHVRCDDPQLLED